MNHGTIDLWSRAVGCKEALSPPAGLAVRFWFEQERRLRDRALFALAIGSKLRGRGLVKVRIGELVWQGEFTSVNGQTLSCRSGLRRGEQSPMLETDAAVLRNKPVITVNGV